MAGNIFTAGGILDVEGTSGNDTVTLIYNFNSPYTVADDSWTFDLNSDDVHVTESTSVFALKQIDFNGYAGNDSLDAGQVGVPMWATGGLGNDSLVGGWGADYLDGGAGVDNMSGGAGVDVIIVSYYGNSHEGLWTQN